MGRHSLNGLYPSTKIAHGIALCRLKPKANPLNLPEHGINQQTTVGFLLGLPGYLRKRTSQPEALSLQARFGAAIVPILGADSVWSFALCVQIAF